MASNPVLLSSESLSSATSSEQLSARRASPTAFGYHQIKAKMRSLTTSGGGIVDHFDGRHLIQLNASVGAGLQDKRYRVPDILMINKYYGLIPQKFTISSRKPAAPSTPNSASSSSRRASLKPRAKSSTQPGKPSTEAQTRGHRSETDSPDPIKMLLGPNAHRASIETEPDPFGPVTRKMSMEKYKKWKASGGKVRRGASLTLVNGKGEPFTGRRKNVEEEEPPRNKRVIKIDLNPVSSWDEEAIGDKTNANFPTRHGESNLFSPAEESNGNDNDDDEESSKMCCVHNAINNDDTWTRHSEPCPRDGKEDTRALSGSLNSTPEVVKGGGAAEREVDELSQGNSRCALDPANDKREEPRSGKAFIKTVSLDDKLLDAELTSSKPDLLQRRPTTATSSSSGKSIFKTPNSFNPPSKVIPWTQRESAGGKPLTLAERRAKFQRAPSIHSSSSLSMSLECGEEELPLSEVESVSVRVPSTAFRESRKSLHVIQPPEIATLIGQITPNADEDIQIEIEKVAIMLRKTQSLQHFSRSLDSGIEVERSSGTSGQHKDGDATPILDGDVGITQSGSESSLSDTDSNSFGGDEGEGSTKLQSLTKSPSPSISEKPQDKGKKAGGSDGQINRQSAIAATTTTVKNSSSRRPPLKKAVSISCEHEVAKAAGKGNEVNSNSRDGNENGKSPRPKTAQARSTKDIIGSGIGTRSTQTHNYTNQNNGSLQSHDQHQNLNNGSQGLRNRKILIKKALLDINQSRNGGRKWGALGRPRTAPSSDKNGSISSRTATQHPQKDEQQKRKPMKASPFPISSGGKLALSTSGKSSVSLTGAGNPGILKSSMEPRATSEAPEDQPPKREPENEENTLKKGQRSPFRQSFSLDEGALLGFSRRSVAEGRIPVFERMSEEGINNLNSGESTPISVSLSILNDEVSFLSSKKREQCLKVYEKMMKTGCSIKLDTIFRGMLTPSEYRAFMKAAERATREEEEDEDEEENEEENGESPGD